MVSDQIEDLVFKLHAELHAAMGDPRSAVTAARDVLKDTGVDELDFRAWHDRFQAHPYRGNLSQNAPIANVIFQNLVRVIIEGSEAGTRSDHIEYARKLLLDALAYVEPAAPARIGF